MTTLEARLRLAFDPARHSQADLARHCGIKPPSVADWFSGKTKSLKAESVILAAEYLQLHPLWLATGRGPMRISDQRALHAAEPVAAYHLPWPFKRLQEAAVRKLSAEELATLEGVIVGTMAAMSLTKP